MADLSSLLNPAPAFDPAPQETDGPDHTTSNGHAKSAHLPPVNTASPSGQPPIKSPLDTLAEAATSSVPLLSPTNPNSSPFNTMTAYALPNPPSSSRPTSSHITPPLPSHAPAPTSPTFSAGLQQYHHPTSKEIRARRPSEAADPSADSLPPLRQSLPDQQFSDTGHSLEQPPQDFISTTILPGIAAAAGLTEDISPHNQIDETTATSQIREPSPGPSPAAQTSYLPVTTSEQAKVKTEITDIAPDLTSSSQPPAQLPVLSAQLKREAGPPVAPIATTDTAVNQTDVLMSDSSPNAMLKPPPASGRKRPAPKKGTATAIKPATKKRKVENIEKSVEKSSPRRDTPTSSRASKTPAPRNRKRESATPQRSSSVANADEEDDEDGVFCICRGPDNHTWMIACDGPCEDWFHGRCINMTEKEGDLIEKYYCPNCSEAGKGETLWKRMCRLEGCIRPARINGTKKSKYCSDEHGCEFMKREALKEEGLSKNTKGGSNDHTDIIVKKGRKTNNSFADSALSSDVDTQTQAPDSSPHPETKEGNGVDGGGGQSHQRGGILRSSELKALVSDVKDVTEFHKLGNGPLNPPPTTEPNDVNMENAAPGILQHSSQIPHTAAESEHLQTLATKKDSLRSRKKLLDDRETFLTLVQNRYVTVFEELKRKDPKLKDICGFDLRLIWSDEEFQIWRDSPEGLAALKERRLGAPRVLDVPRELAPHLQEAQVMVNGDHAVNGIHANGDHDAAGSSTAAPTTKDGEPQPEVEEIGKGVCQKERCGRHKNWAKLQREEIAFAKDEVRQGMRKLDEEEKGWKDRAKIRWLETKD